MKNCQSNYDDLTQNGVNLRKPMAAINSSQKSLPCVQESKLIRTKSFLSLSLSLKRTLLAYSLSPSETYAHLLSSSLFSDIRPEECGNRGIYSYVRRTSCLARKMVTLRMRCRKAIVKK